jgi:hypothetical protein
VTSFSRQKCSNSKNKNIRFLRMTCSMFMGNLVETGWKLKKLKHIGVFACIFDRRGCLPKLKSWRRHCTYCRRFRKLSYSNKLLPLFAFNNCLDPACACSSNLMNDTYHLRKLWWLKFYPECSSVFYDRSNENNVSREPRWSAPLKIYCLHS